MNALEHVTNIYETALPKEWSYSFDFDLFWFLCSKLIEWKLRQKGLQVSWKKKETILENRARLQFQHFCCAAEKKAVDT